MTIFFLVLSPYFVFFFFLYHLWSHLWHVDVPRLGAESELQLLACTTGTATQKPSCVYNLHHSLQQRGILNPLNEARDRTCVLMDINQICFC